MLFKIGILIVTSALVCAEDSKWVWNGNNRDGRGREATPGLKFKQADARYEVLEPEDPNSFGLSYNPGSGYRPQGGQNNIRPGGVYGNGGYGNGPGGGGGGGVGGGGGGGYNRPGNFGGGYGNGPVGGDYGNGGGGYYQGNDRDPGILTGPVPSWAKERPFRNYDSCKCTERFNCQSPGISFGNCDVAKKYCCNNRNRNDNVGGSYPSRPIHSPENGVLVGPGGPVDGPISGGYRPNGVRPGGGRPGGGRPGGGFGVGGSPNNRPIHSPENGILVGPGGPFDTPGGYNGYNNVGRAKKQ